MSAFHRRNRFWHLVVSVFHEPGIKLLCVNILVLQSQFHRRVVHHIIISLAHATRLTRERTLVRVAGIFRVGALSGNHHRSLHVAEVVSFDKSIRCVGTTDAVGSHAVVVVVIDMRRSAVQSRRARVAVVEPVMVERQQQVDGLARSTSATHHLTIVEEMVVGNGCQRRAILHVDTSVALHLVGLSPRTAVEEVTVVHPCVVVVRIHRDGIVAIEHDAQVSQFDTLRALHVDAVAVESGVAAYALQRDILQHACGIVLSLEVDVFAILQSLVLRSLNGAHHADDERRLVVSLSVCRKNVGKPRIGSRRF